VSRRARLAVVVGAVLLLTVVVALSMGAYDISATARPSSLEKAVAGWVRDASIRARAPRNIRAPSDPATLVKGRAEYAEHCQVCHGIPDGAQSSIAQGLNPPVPDLAEPATQARSDGELFFIVSRGIRLSGMPGFAKSEPDDVRWALVAFVRHLPRLSAEERAELEGKH
jgi:mono/diheme cytochrome c family protein